MFIYTMLLDIVIYKGCTRIPISKTIAKIHGYIFFENK